MTFFAGLLLIGGAGSPTTTEFVKTNIEVGLSDSTKATVNVYSKYLKWFSQVWSWIKVVQSKNLIGTPF